MTSLSQLQARRSAAKANAAEALRKAAFAIGGRLGFVTFVGAIVHLPAVIAVVVLEAMPAYAVLGVTAMISGPVMAAAMTEHTILGLGADRAPFGETVRHALGAAVRTLPLALAVAVIQSFGYALLFVPGIVATVLLALAIPIQVVERVSAGAALSRSVKLAVGGRWALLIALFTAGSLAALAGRLVGIVFGELGFAFALVLQSALLGAAAAVVYADRRLAHEGVEIDALVTQLGGTPNGAGRALDADVERALANANNASPSAVSPSPRSVRDDELIEGATGRDRRMKVVKVAAAATAVLGLVTMGGLGVLSRVQGKRDADAASVKLLSDLARARGSDRVVIEAIMSRPDLYGKRLGALGVALSDPDPKYRTMLVISHFEDELATMGCTDAVVPSKRSGNARDFANGCPAAPLLAEDASGIEASALATATVLEARVAKLGKTGDLTHQAIVKALISRR